MLGARQAQEPRRWLSRGHLQKHENHQMVGLWREQQLKDQAVSLHLYSMSRKDEPTTRLILHVFPYCQWGRNEKEWNCSIRQSWTFKNKCTWLVREGSENKNRRQAVRPQTLLNRGKDAMAGHPRASTWWQILQMNDSNHSIAYSISNKKSVMPQVNNWVVAARCWQK